VPARPLGYCNHDAIQLTPSRSQQLTPSRTRTRTRRPPLRQPTSGRHGPSPMPPRPGPGTVTSAHKRGDLHAGPAAAAAAAIGRPAGRPGGQGQPEARARGGPVTSHRLRPLSTATQTVTPSQEGPVGSDCHCPGDLEFRKSRSSLSELEAAQPVNYSDRECCAKRKGEMWRFLICLECCTKER
jgi:hypothetical protein